MERLTEKINGWTFEETVKSAENLMEAEENMFKWDVLRHLRDFAELYKDKIAEYESLEEQGRLLKLPCKVGDTIYYIEDNVINEFVVYSFDIRPLQKFVCNYEGIRLNFKNFGKTVFLTQSEAEQKLKEMESQMWIGELNHHCGNCPIIDYCAEPYYTPHLCAYEELADVSVEDYKRTAESVTEEEIEDKLRQYEENNVSPWNDKRNGAICDIVLEKMFYRE